jgi:folate-binding Fe-S cluster repair protein YgfZ
MFLYSLCKSSLLVFSGDDARTFLQAQFTSDVAGLAPDKSQYSGYCTPKGRLIASFLLWRNDSGYVLQLPADLSAPILKRLSMYILRSNVKAADAGAEYAIPVAGLPSENCVTVTALGCPGGAWAIWARRHSTSSG